MVSAARPRPDAAITLVELLVVAAVTSVLLVLLIASFGPAREQRALDMCMSNLKAFGSAFRLSGTNDRNSPLTNSVSAYLLTRTQYLASPRMLVCPADTRKPARSFADLKDENISYFIGLNADETRPSAVVAGHRHLTVNGTLARPGLLVVGPTDVLGLPQKPPRCWANVLRADGSVTQLTLARNRVQHLQAGVSSNRFLIP